MYNTFLLEHLDNLYKVNLTYPQYVWMQSAISCQAHYCKVEPDYVFKVLDQEDTNTNVQVFMNKYKEP